MFGLGFHEFDIDMDYFKLNSTHYDCVINISQLFEELGLNNIHQQFYVFCYLLWNGYFSIDKSYVYDNKNIVDEDNTIFLGRGCCRHNSELMEEVFKLLDIEAREMGLRVKKIEPQRLIRIKRKIECFEEPSDLSRGECNHSVTLVGDSSAYFLFDSTNLIECEILNKSKLVSFGGEYKVNRRTFSKELIEVSYHAINRKPTMSESLLISNYEKARDVCEKNKNLFNDFYDDNHPNYEKIRQLVLKG